MVERLEWFDEDRKANSVFPLVCQIVFYSEIIVKTDLVQITSFIIHKQILQYSY